ncbi:TetR/AcrR family transcriptional regulator, partial [Conexibacter sp. JD483]|uniref:TetR/AcrR family transcriptional regulator n=2 Tax=Conexibacter TaxID=191494 RepID=UPI00287063B4
MPTGSDAIEPLSRRERLRAQTLDEIKQHALAQVAEGGAGALSLNAIAKAMGMSGPAIYRYFAAREELLGALVTDGYGELAEVVRSAAAIGPRRAPARRLAQVADAYRAWALANPYRYGLLFSVRPPGYAEPGEAISAIQPAMGTLLELLGRVAKGAADARARGAGGAGAGGAGGAGAG